MDTDESKIRDIMAIKEHLEQKAEECETELDLIRRNIAILDSIVKKSIFTRASDLKVESKLQPSVPLNSPPLDSRPITIDSRTVAYAIVAPNELKIIIEDGVNLHSDIPPLKTFFVEHIIGDMRAKDQENVQNGSLNSGSVIECTINEDSSSMRDIIVKNYGNKERVDKIIDSVSWSLERMVEHAAK